MATLFLFGLSASVYAYSSLFDEPTSAIDRDDGLFGTWDDDFKGYSSEDWSGFYIGTFGGNDSKTYLEDLASIYLGYEFTSDFYAKVDEPETDSSFLTVSYDTDYLSGTWTLDAPYEIGFYSVKGANEFALYFVFPYDDSGKWSTTHLLTPITSGSDGNIPEISHLSVLADKGIPVPEPGMVILLGIGLLGLAFYNRKRLLN